MIPKIKGFLANPEYDSIKAMFLIGTVVVAGMFIVSQTSVRDSVLPGFVVEGDVVEANIVLSSVQGAEEIESGILGTHTAKMYDEMAIVGEGWLDAAKDLMEESGVNVLRYPAGGVVKYHHVWTDYMDQSLTSEETASLVNGNEIRGIGQIIEDRVDEESRGNDGELGEITDPKPKYDNESYLEGFQNSKPRNFIHDVVEIVDESGADMLYVINMRYATPEEVAQQVEFLINNGVDIVGYEFDNEVYAKGHFYFESGNPETKAPLAVTEYLNDTVAFRDAILEVDSNALFGVVAAPKRGFEETADGFDGSSDWNSVWNESLASQMSSYGYDRYIMHFYHGFFLCLDEFSSMDRDSIFSCAENDLSYFTKVEEPQSGSDITSLPPILDYYYNLFGDDKKMWVTEWNINQDPNRTDGTLANSILHGAFVTQFNNLLNDANTRNGNFIEFANIHTFATDGGNALVNRRSVGSVASTEPVDYGDFVRRTPFYAIKHMDKIFTDNTYPVSINQTPTTDGAYVYAYKNSSGEILLSFSNLSSTNIKIANISFDGKNIDTSKSSAQMTATYGDENYSSNGATEFSKNPGFPAYTVDESYSDLSLIYIPAHSFGTIIIDPKILSVEEETGEENPVQEEDETSQNSQDTGEAPKSENPKERWSVIRKMFK